MNLNRRHCIALATSLACAGIKAQAAASTPTAGARRTTTIVVVGDSLSAEYGLTRGSGWVALLEQKLIRERVAASVVNASISGDTSAGGRARLPALLRQHRPQVVVIELGGNDALRGLPIEMTQDNLTTMAGAARQAGARVVLLGMEVPPNYGRDYNQRFAAMFAQVAKDQQALLVPFFLKGIGDVPDSARWFQADRIHPTEAAQTQLLANVWPTLRKAIP